MHLALTCLCSTVACQRLSSDIPAGFCRQKNQYGIEITKLAGSVDSDSVAGPAYAGANVVELATFLRLSHKSMGLVAVPALNGRSIFLPSAAEA